MRKRESILIIDDDVSFRTYLETVLQDDGYRCFHASNAVEAWSVLKRNIIDLCLLDIVMPGESGDELLKRIKRIYPDVGVIMVSGLFSVEISGKCNDSGADDYLLKPFEPQRLLLTLANVLDRRRFLREKKHYQNMLDLKLADNSEQKKIAQSRLIQYEKLSAIAQFAALIGSEMSHPLEEILIDLTSLQKHLANIRCLTGIAPLVEIQNDDPQRSGLSQKEMQKEESIREAISMLIDDCLDATGRIEQISQRLEAISDKHGGSSRGLDIKSLDDAVAIIWNEIKNNAKLEKK